MNYGNFRNINSSIYSLANNFIYKQIRRKKEKVFTDILNGDTALNLFNTGRYEEYIITFTNKKGQEEIYPVWANSEQQAKILFATETGESYLRIIKITH